MVRIYGMYMQWMSWGGGRFRIPIYKDLQNQRSELVLLATNPLAENPHEMCGWRSL